MEAFAIRFPIPSHFLQAHIAVELESSMKGRVPAGNIKLKRAYDTPAPKVGMRIIVDSLWPRGLSKQRAAIDQWVKDISPSTKLRQWLDMILAVNMNSAAAMPQRCTNTPSF